jgi:hypothetical protein
LAPGDPSLRLGLAAARHADGNALQGLEELGALLAANPGWTEGHTTFAQLSGLTGRSGAALDTIAAAVATAPDAPQLVLQAIDLSLLAGDYHAVLEWAERGERRFEAAEAWTEARAIAHDELGQRGLAAEEFTSLGEPDSSARAVRLIRHHFRTGAIQRAAELVERWIGGAEAELVWPYAAIAWRLTDPRRAAWLEHEGDLVAAVDLGMEDKELAALAGVLDGLHDRAGAFPGQSVRGGTQTDGVLLARLEPPIVELRQRFADAVQSYRGRLPPTDPAHPMLRHLRTGQVTFAGSWSVRLAEAGSHVAHYHPAGWISSAYYVRVPDSLQPGEGALELGRPPVDLEVNLAALKVIDPVPGNLVMFPSWMWHGTTPFAGGERLTAAFDVAQP